MQIDRVQGKIHPVHINNVYPYAVSVARSNPDITLMHGQSHLRRVADDVGLQNLRREGALDGIVEIPLKAGVLEVRRDQEYTDNNKTAQQHDAEGNASRSCGIGHQRDDSSFQMSSS